VYKRQGLEAELRDYYNELNIVEAYTASAEAIACRSLKNCCLGYLMLLEGNGELAHQQYINANNMTDQFCALVTVVRSELSSIQPLKETLLSDFYQRWKDEALVVNQWLNVQASFPHAATLDTVKTLMEHECFSMTNPNKVRSLIGAFTQNAVAFHQQSGKGYEFLAEQIIALNAINPQIAARMVTPLTRWKKYDQTRQELMRSYLEKIAKVEGLSKDVYEVVSKSL